MVVAMTTRFRPFPLDSRNIAALAKSVTLGCAILLVDRRLHNLGPVRLVIDAALYAGVALAIGIVHIRESTPGGGSVAHEKCACCNSRGGRKSMTSRGSERGERLESSSTLSVGGESTLRVSVVLATYNRLESLIRLLSSLTRQTLPADRFEVIVVDDGSTIPVRGHVNPSQYAFSVRIIEQANGGPSSARHHGVLEARGEILVLVDDDMDLPPGFLETHLGYHASDHPTAVFGRYASDPTIGEKSISRTLPWCEVGPAFARYRQRASCGRRHATGYR